MTGCAHRCHAYGCTTAVVPTKLMCLAHWKLVPADIKRRVLSHYRSGQCLDRKLITSEWRAAARDAIRAVAERETGR